MTVHPCLPGPSPDSAYDADVRVAREGPTVALWALVAVLVVVCAVAGMQVAEAADSRARKEEQQARYAEVLAAAQTEAEAFVNVRHDTAEEDLARIAAGAAGQLKARYTDDADRIVRTLRRERTVTSGTVLWTGVVRVDADAATVLVATTGSRKDRSTQGKEVARNLRLQLSLVPVDGEWLASEIELVD